MICGPAHDGVGKEMRWGGATCGPHMLGAHTATTQAVYHKE